MTQHTQDFAGQPPGEDAAKHPAAASQPSDLDRFITIISHDLRGSIRALRDVPSWIEEDLAQAGTAVPEDVGDYLTMLATHATRLDRFMVDLLTYSRVGRLQKVRAMDLSQISQKVLAELGSNCFSSFRQEFEINTLILGDADAERLVATLLRNAAVHGGVAVDCVIGTRAGAGGPVLWVEDSGPGIAADLRAKALEPMATLKPRDEVEGSGMGLAIARKIAETYGGTLSLDEGRAFGGLRVEVLFPATVAVGDGPTLA
jgi:signal transduction histidine kinase